jgi:hypothetical protein
MAEWEANMLTYGAMHCDQTRISSLGTWEGSVWYYDGIRAYYQIADYTGDPQWITCARYVADVYRNYVFSAEGKVPGWRVFPQGLYVDYLKSADAESLRALKLLADNSVYAYQAGDESYIYSRETAYLLETFFANELVGAPLPEKLAKTVNFALGHLTQWTEANSAEYVQPYLVGLTLEALIAYYERTRDNRIPAAVKKSIDWLWDHAWVSDAQAFLYIICKPGASYPECSNDPTETAGDLNMLIAPAFAWYYHLTGDTTYLDRGDAIFAGGVDERFVAYGKQFTQNYRWSFDYIRWRLGKRN